MPLYEYECAACGERTEAIQSFSEPPLTVCPHCGGALVKLLSSPAVQFKGAGWYVTDYGKGGGAKERTGGKEGEKTGDSSKGEDGQAGRGGGAPADGGAGESGKTGDSSKGEEGGGRGAASGPPGAAPPPAPSRKKNRRTE